MAELFFDSKDLLQVRYEMLRRHRVDGDSVVRAVSAFGVSRPTFYQAQTAFQRSGLTGLVPKQRGPKEGHKLSSAIIKHVRTLKASTPGLTTTECVKRVQETFGIKVHRRSLERALAGKKKLRKSPEVIAAGRRHRSIRGTAPASDPAGRRHRAGRGQRHPHTLWIGAMGAGAEFSHDVDIPLFSSRQLPSRDPHRCGPGIGPTRRRPDPQ
jgi:transposase